MNGIFQNWPYKIPEHGSVISWNALKLSLNRVFVVVVFFTLSPLVLTRIVRNTQYLLVAPFSNWVDDPGKKASQARLWASSKMTRRRKAVAMIGRRAPNCDHTQFTWTKSCNDRADTKTALIFRPTLKCSICMRTKSLIVFYLAFQAQTSHYHNASKIHLTIFIHARNKCYLWLV